MRTQALEQYDVSPIRLWSPLQRQLATCGLLKGSPQQWLGTIRNLQKRGVSAVEIEWSGIMPMLEEDTESARVLEALRALAADLEGTPARERVEDAPPVLRIDELLDFLSEKPPCELVLQRHVTDEYLPFVHYEKQQRPTTLPPIVVRKGRREVRLLHYMDRAFGLCIWLNVDVDTELFGRHRYWSLSVPRGRKKLAPGPVGRRFISAQKAMAYGRVLVERMARRLAAQGFVGQTRSFNRWTRYALPGGEHYTEWLITAPNLAVEYWSEHFKLANIVAHVRTTERLDPHRARLLVLEEIQSDWNQALRKAIQADRERLSVHDDERDMIDWDDDLEPPPFNPYLNHWLEAALRMMLMLAANQGFAGIAWLPGKLHAERFPWANAEGLKVFYDRIVPAAVDKLAKSWGARSTVAEFSTLSRRFLVRKLETNASWDVISLDSGKVVGADFVDYGAAEAFRRTMEAAVLESVTAVYFTNEMRDDIRENGLPCLGAVGKRAAIHRN